ncbi:hypothetical protein ABIC09_007398 [Bradyrhizobium sp. S3.12.5]
MSLTGRQNVLNAGAPPSRPPRTISVMASPSNEFLTGRVVELDKRFEEWILT